MINQIFLTLPVANLLKSVAFFRHLALRTIHSSVTTPLPAS